MRAETHARGNEAARPRREIEVLSVRELFTRPRMSWRVRHVLPEKGFAVIYGPSGAGKTFVALNLACAVARSPHWFDRRVKKGRVVYVAAEGALGMRLAAYMEHHGLTEADLDGLAIVEQSINLLDDEEDGGDLDELVASIREAIVVRRWEGVNLIVVDTLNRAMPGGDENGSADMGLMVAAAKQIEVEFSCLFAYVHHAGKDESKGSRGHSSLKAATDAELSVKANGAGPRIVHVGKVRENEDGYDLGAFDLERIDLGPTRDHDPDADEDERDWSCVVVPCALPEAKKGDGLNTSARLALSYLHRCLDTAAQLPPLEVRRGAGKTRPKDGQTVCPVDTWRTYALDAGGLSTSDKPETHSKAFNRARGNLELAGKIGVYKGWVWLRDNRDKDGTK